MVANAFSGVFALLLCISIGVLAAKLRYIDEGTEKKLSKLTLHFSVPCLLFQNCMQYIDRKLIVDLGFLLFIPGFIILIGYGCAVIVAKLFRVRRENFGLFCVMFSMSNTIFIGLPVCLAVFGEVALPLVAAYFPFNTLMFWTLGAVGIAADGGVKLKLDVGIVNKVFSPPLVGTLLGAVFALGEWTLPGFVNDAMRYMGNMTTPAACLLAGCTIAHMGKNTIKITREGGLTFAGRFVLSPMIAYALCLVFSAPVLVAQVFMVEAAMPVMSQSMLAARAYNANYKLAAQMIALTTVVGLLYVPLLVFILQVIF